MDIIKNIKRLLKNISVKIQYSQCYTDMEYSGKAVFGMCCGHDFECCDLCPYYTDIDEK